MRLARGALRYGRAGAPDQPDVCSREILIEESNASFRKGADSFETRNFLSLRPDTKRSHCLVFLMWKAKGKRGYLGLQLWGDGPTGRITDLEGIERRLRNTFCRKPVARGPLILAH